MAKRILTVKSIYGFHMRPITQTVKAASGYCGEVTIQAKGLISNAKSVMSLAVLALNRGDNMEVECEDEAVIDKIENILNCFDYDEVAVEIVNKIPNNLSKFIQKKSKKEKTFFSSKTFTESLQKAVDEGQVIDEDKIFQIGHYWCINGKIEQLILALGISANNPLIIVRHH